MKRVVAVLAAGAVWLSAPAMAQQPVDKTAEITLTDAQTDEAYCVYDYLGTFADEDKLTNAYMAGDPDSADYKEQIGMVDEGAASCGAEFKWSEDRKATASMMALYSTMGDVLDGRLAANGLTEKDLDAVYNVADTMPASDIDIFLDGKWMTDKDLGLRTTKKLRDTGLKDEAVITNAFYLLEAYIIATLLLDEWVKGLPKG